MNNGGALTVELLPEYTPQDGDSISLVQATEVIGEFASVDVQGVPVGFEADVQVTNDEVVLTLNAAVLLGDTNRDGLVSFLDISPFISLLTSNGFLDQADINRDGVVNFFDVAPFIGILSGN